MEINCEHVWREVSNYLDGQVDAELRAAVEAHVRGCKRCAAVLDGTRNVVQVIGDERVLELPVGFEQRLRQKLEAEMGPLMGPLNIRVPKKSYFGWLAFAAAAALVFAAFALGGGSRPQLKSEMAHPAGVIPATLMVVVSEDGKAFHGGPGCKFLHDRARLRTIPASQALAEGYVPCAHCMKQYLSAGLARPVEVADIDIPGYQSRRTP